MPPLRTAGDKALLLQALLDGTVDCFASLHRPLSTDEKICEFPQALFGASTLEACFGALWSLLEENWSIEQLIEKLTTIPAKLFGIPRHPISEGTPACLSLFNPSATYTFSEAMIRSASANSPFIGKQLKGKVLGIINENRILLNEAP